MPFLGNGTLDPHDGWTPAGPLGTPSSMPLGLPMTQPWRPFGVLPSGRKVQGGFSMAWNGGQVTFVSIRGAGHLAIPALPTVEAVVDPAARAAGASPSRESPGRTVG